MKSNQIYFKGDKAEYVTGKPVKLYGGTFYAVVLLEGHAKGETRYTVKPPEAPHAA